MKHLYLLLFFVFTSLVTTAQGLPGYVITLSGDTLRGTVAEKKGQRLILYSAGSQSAQQFSPAQVRGYGLRGKASIDSRVVRTAAGRDFSCFVLPQHLGTASLYSYASEDGFLLLPPGRDTLQELSATNWHLLFNRYLRGCPTLDPSSPSVLTLSFTEAHLVRTLAQYNRCLDPQWRAVAPAGRPAWVSGMGLHAMASYLVSNNGTALKRSSSQQFSLEYVGVRASGLQVGARAGFTRFDQTTRTGITPFSPPQTEEQYRYKVNLLTSAISMGHRLGRAERPNLYLGMGVGFSYLVSGTTETRRRPVGGSTLTLVGNEEDYVEGIGVIHYEATAGVVLPLRPSQELRVAAVYQYYVLAELSSIGAQLSYYLFRR